MQEVFRNSVVCLQDCWDCSEELRYARDEFEHWASDKEVCNFLQCDNWADSNVEFLDIYCIAGVMLRDYPEMGSTHSHWFSCNYFRLLCIGFVKQNLMVMGLHPHDWLF